MGRDARYLDMGQATAQRHEYIKVPFSTHIYISIPLTFILPDTHFGSLKENSAVTYAQVPSYAHTKTVLYLFFLFFLIPVLTGFF